MEYINIQYFESLCEIFHCVTSFNCTVSNKSVFLFNSSTEGNLLANTCTDRVGKLNFHDILINKINKLRL